MDIDETIITISRVLRLIRRTRKMWETFIIHAFMGVLVTVFKDPKKKAELKAILLEVRNSINEAYPGD